YEIETNLNSLVPLNELLLPEDERTRLGSEILIKNGKITKKLDHCVTSENLESEYFFHIKNKAKEYGILVSTENNPFPLNYFQIYTPNLNSIAIEPMSSCADVFNNPNSIPTCLQPKQSLLFFVKIVLTN
ncbi:MAG: hypothetical protein KDK36_06525, partial [Leptospiraceae bacterium]|nr:hypothetical protein [Leptospiraceae bacterium]